MTEPAGGRKLMEEAWDEVAEGYLSYWSPRFAPYLERAVELFQPAPKGPLVVAGCGPGEEVLLLGRKFPGRAVVATDLSPAMVSIARRRALEAGLPNVLAAVDDGSQVSARVRQAAGVLSSFVLQLLPNPMAALADWSRSIQKEGSIAALFWPRSQGATSFSRLRQLVRDRAGEPLPDWEPAALEGLSRTGLRLVSDELVEREMAHGSPEECWVELHQHGPMRATALRIGERAMEELKASWLKDHGLEERGGQWVHRPAARLWLLERADRD